MKPMRVVFMGASDIGWRCCQALFQDGRNVVGILSIPESFRVSWSSAPLRNVRFKSFEDLAEQHRRPLAYVAGGKDPVIEERLRQWAPDLLVVVGWYYMLSPGCRALAARGAVGVHASLLPRYRGGAPLVWAVIRGETETGTTLFHLADGTDDGDIIAQERFSITPDEDIAHLIEKAAVHSVALVRRMIPKIEDGTAPRIPQDRGAASVMPQRTPEDGYIDFAKTSGAEAYNRIRAQSKPYPGAFSQIGGRRVTIWRARPVPESAGGRPTPGTFFPSETHPDALSVACTDGVLDLFETEPRA